MKLTVKEKALLDDLALEFYLRDTQNDHADRNVDKAYNEAVSFLLKRRDWFEEYHKENN